jgi:hypothetical protein
MLDFLSRHDDVVCCVMVAEFSLSLGLHGEKTSTDILTDVCHTSAGGARAGGRSRESTALKALN